MPDRPTGTVTFLFTDIEGSTKLWEHQADLMQEAFRRHEAILREAIAAHGGYAYKMIGDAFQAAFQTAPAALAASIEAQRALASKDWGEIGPIRVRMALHTGAVEERGDDYVGPLLNRVARLLSTGHGGQILLTATTRELVRDSLPPDVSLHDLGEHRLKDLVRPEHVFQVVAPDVTADFPPLKSLDTRPNNLPVQSTPLIGREQAVAALRDLLLRPGVRLVTLTGPGGTGKTRLGLQVAADLLDHFEHGVYFVNLAPISDPALVASAIAQPVAVREHGGKPLLESLKDYLRDKHLLLLLDNFEQVTAAAPLVADLLAAAPRLSVLVTSREVLHLYGEHDVAVLPLTLPDPGHPMPLERLTQYEAVRLFIERAQAARSDFAVTNENAPAVAEICYRLDGLPLAIELAAARIRLLPPQAMLQRLTSRLRLLIGGARNLPERQQTLRGAIAWSYDLLEQDEQTLFRRLAVFVGGFGLDAVEAVCNVPGDLDVDVLDAVESLVGKSLLREAAAADEPRLGMLETIREYALERLDQGGEADETRRRHAAYFLQVAEEAEPQLAGRQQIAWLNRLELEHDNLRAALRWAIDCGDAATALRLVGSLSRFWHDRGYAGEGRQWLAQALALPGATAHVR
ncbi:MAG TPA: adenylate/guanylate cyclase domain-containing protein, partial [Herpetosiphonaceae bacterium]|nr:adenylate/guanylate cyclase domain-containing protein [Herpetosiphonaceae bacterium]